MQEKDTNELDKILARAHSSDYESFLEENKDSILSETNDFTVYMKQKFKEKNVTQRWVFIKADIPEKYGYRILNGEKRTVRRDVIIRICYAAGFDLRETNRALRKYKMPELYAKDKRDALIILNINNRTGSVLDLNEQLMKYNLKALQTSGVQD